jgi:flavin reductase (DIM6/NTAB) family NADH-FMN oxidoreductase RutF
MATPITTTRPDPTQHRELRTALGRHATGVAIATTTDSHDDPVGLTVNSFTSLSLDPPLVLWCLRRSSASLPTFTAADYFAINLLAANQHHLAQQFAAVVHDRFAAVPCKRHPHGPPLLAGTIGTFICQRSQLIQGGDHVIIIGRITDYHMSPGTPLLFIDGKYRRRLGSARR